MSSETAPKLPPKPSREQAKVIYAYVAQNEDELTINEGDIINVLSKEIEDQGWFKGELNGKVGVFPDNFVELIKVSGNDEEAPKPPPPRPKGTIKDSASSKSTSPATVNGAKGESRTPTILKKIMGSVGAKPPPNVQSGSGGRGSPSLSSSPKSSSGFGAKAPPDVVPHQETSSTSNSNLLNRSISSCEEGELVSELAPLDSSSAAVKLLTNPSRPKGPTNRRPPSYIAIVKDESGLENGDGPKHAIHHANNDSAKTGGQVVSNNNNNEGSKLGSPSNQGPKSGLGKTAMNDDSQPPAPWMIELRKTQELKRGGSKDVPSPPSATSDSIVSTNPDSSNSTSTPVSAAVRPVSMTASVRGPNRASGDFTSRMQQLLKKDGSIEEPSTTSPSSNNSPGSMSSNKPNKPSNKPISTSSSTTSPSLNKLVTPSPTANVKDFLNNSNNSISNGLSTKPSIAGKLASCDVTQSSSSLVSSSAVTSSNGSSAINAGNLADLQKDMKHLKDSMVSRKDFEDLVKQLNELKSSFESYKVSQKDVVKELINDVAEERKKVATLQIEVDRLRKLSTTV